MSYVKIVDLVLLGALGGSVALNVVQTRKIQSLTAPPSVVAANKGVQVPPLPVKTPDGADALIAGGDLPLLVYFFSESCSWCEQNVEHLKAVESQVRGRYRVVGVSLSKLKGRDYGQRHGLGLPLYDSPDSRVLASYGVKGTPQTLVISPDGRVLESWMGAYVGTVKESVERTLGVRL